MPTLEEMVGVLDEFPDGKLLINQKDRDPDTLAAILRTVSAYPEELRARLLHPA